MNLVNEHVRPDDNLEGSPHCTHTSETRVYAQAICRGDDCHNHSARGGWIVLRNITEDGVNISERCVGESYSHRGRGSFFFVPSDSNQRRTSS